MNRLVFTVPTHRNPICPICTVPLVSQAIRFIEGYAFCVSCAGLHDERERSFPLMVIDKHGSLQDGENWSTELGLLFYTPDSYLRRRAYMELDPNAPAVHVNPDIVAAARRVD